jgi:hypothetical protein
VSNLGYLSWRSGTLQPAQKLNQAVPASLSHNLDPAIEKIFRRSDQAKLERVTTHPPPETHALYPTSHPCRESGLRAGIAVAGVGVIAEIGPLIRVVVGTGRIAARIRARSSWAGHQRPCLGRR